MARISLSRLSLRTPPPAGATAFVSRCGHCSLTSGRVRFGAPADEKRAHVDGTCAECSALRIVHTISRTGDDGTNLASSPPLLVEERK